MTKVIFDKLHVDAEDIGGHDLAEGFRGLIEAESTISEATRHRTTTSSDEPAHDKSDPFLEEGAALDRLTDADLLGVILSDDGSSNRDGGGAGN